MLKLIKQYIDLKLIKSIFIFALSYCLLFNSAIFLYKFHYFQADTITAILELAKDFIYNLITLFIIFYGLAFMRLFFAIGSIFLFVSGAVASYYLYFFSIAPSKTIMLSVFATHQTEVQELVSLRLIIWIVFAIIFCIYLLKKYNMCQNENPFSKLISAICIYFLALNILHPQHSFLRTYFPLQYLHNSYEVLFNQNENFTREDIHKSFSFEEITDNEDVIGVFVIGESARYGNFGINGYHRNTTPLLSKMNNVISYKSRSCSSSTFLSVPCMLSRYGEKNIDKIEHESTLLSVLTKLGFETIWIGTQSITKHYKNRKGGSFYDEVNFHMIPGGSIVMLPNSHDGKLLPYLEQNIESAGKKFIVLHTTGSHWNYSARYPKEFEKFKPVMQDANNTDAASCKSTERLNSYDNSILYTDYVLSAIINRLKNKKAFVIYASDHGESLGENGCLTHGSEKYVKEQRQVPFIVWMSDSYKASNKKKWKLMQKKKKKYISHDYIFHTILDCLNIKSDAIDPKLSLCK